MLLAAEARGLSDVTVMTLGIRHAPSFASAPGPSTSPRSFRLAQPYRCVSGIRVREGRGSEIGRTLRTLHGRSARGLDNPIGLDQLAPPGHLVPTAAPIPRHRTPNSLPPGGSVERASHANRASETQQRRRAAYGRRAERGGRARRGRWPSPPSAARRPPTSTSSPNAGFESRPVQLDLLRRAAAPPSPRPVHGGPGALKATPSGSDNAQCTQTVGVQAQLRRTRSARGCRAATSTSAPPAPAPPTVDLDAGRRVLDQQLSVQLHHRRSTRTR